MDMASFSRREATAAWVAGSFLWLTAMGGGFCIRTGGELVGIWYPSDIMSRMNGSDVTDLHWVIWVERSGAAWLSLRERLGSDWLRVYVDYGCGRLCPWKGFSLWSGLCEMKISP